MTTTKKEAKKAAKKMMAQEQSGIPGETEIILKLPASSVVALLGILESIAAPRKETDILYIPITQQYQAQFNKKLKAV